MILKLLLGIIALGAAPVLGGLLAGVDRRITAKFQSRMGPPVLQPFYDVAKLWGKERNAYNVWVAFSSWVYLGAAASSCALFFMGSDLLLIFFIQAIGAVFLIIGALSVPSPYSQVGAHRELMQVLTYEPLLILVIVGINLVTGSFRVDTIIGYDTPLLMKLPLLFIVLGYALTIKLRKSPFDISASHHANQEVNRGVYTEYSGRYLALCEIAHWYEVILVLGLCGLFFATNIVGLVVLLAATYMAEIIIDNATSRMTWRWMLGSVWLTGLGLSIANLTWLYAGK
ncbi:MAG: respiratory chain complex I subunit 1 family protein [Desulfovibrio sp.]